jgi:subtilisin family serine protease
MRTTLMVVLGLALAFGVLQAATPSYETVIVTPVSQPATVKADPTTRSGLVEILMDQARRSQKKLLADLNPLTIGSDAAAVKEFHSIWIVNRVIVTATREVIDQIAKRSDVVSVRPAQTIPLVKPVATDATAAEYGVDKVRAPEVWSKHSIDGSGVLVGHLDTGVYVQHPDLAGKVAKFKDFFGSTASESFDGQGHGTHTAGTIVGGSASGKAIGVAPGAKLIVGRIFNNSGSTTDDVILLAMNWIADPDGNPQTADAPRLVSCSWGGPKSGDTSGGDLWTAAQHWVDLEILPVFAAGNSGPGAKTVGTPGAFPHVLAVGATNATDAIASFSSRGPARWDGTDYIKPDVSAPGSNIKSAKDNGGYTTMSGTSMACPTTAGVVALVIQANPALKVKQLVDIMRSTAKDLGAAGQDNNFGWGLIDAVKAVEKAKSLAAFDLRRGE